MKMAKFIVDLEMFKQSTAPIFHCSGKNQDVQEISDSIQQPQIFLGKRRVMKCAFKRPYSEEFRFKKIKKLKTSDVSANSTKSSSGNSPA